MSRKLELRKVELSKYSRFRTLYVVYRAATQPPRMELFCFLGMRTGWGRSWEFFPLMLGGVGEPAVTEDGTLYRVNGDKGRIVRAKSKEDALAQVEAGADVLPPDWLGASELLQRYRVNTAQARKTLQDTLDRLSDNVALYQRYIEALRWIDANTALSSIRSEALRESAAKWEADIKSCRGAAEMAQKELDSLLEL